ncbi:hypothetical protein HDU67_003430, partial [Dinochytrium kinnereticum]
DLARHAATHLLPAEKIYVCSNALCEKRFGRLDAAKRHARLSCSRRVRGVGAMGRKRGVSEELEEGDEGDEGDVEE